MSYFLDMLEFFKHDPILSSASGHFLEEVNATLPYFPILMYVWAKALNAKNILEVGIAEGYSARYLAQAAEENDGMYYGIDINKHFCEEAEKNLTTLGLKHKIICADTYQLEKIDFVPQIDIAFLDGEHTTEAVLHEVELIYSLLASKGNGYIFIHDIVDMGNSMAWLKLKQDSRFETLGIGVNYGLGILRKANELNYEKNAEMFENSREFKRVLDQLTNIINKNNYKKIIQIGINDGNIAWALLSHTGLYELTLMGYDSRKIETGRQQELFSSEKIHVEYLDPVIGASRYEDKSCDLVFVNMGNFYEESKEIISSWLPKIKDGGCICGEGYSLKGNYVHQAVNSIIDKVNLFPQDAQKELCFWWKYI